MQKQIVSKFLKWNVILKAIYFIVAPKRTSAKGKIKWEIIKSKKRMFC